MLQVGVLTPVNKATPWINSFVLVESKDKLGNLKSESGDVFQHKLDQGFGKIDQVIVIVDDIMIVGKKRNHRDHDIALTTLLETARKYNVKLNFDKLQYKKTEVDFFGETYTTDGCKPAQSKVSAIVDMPTPTCEKQVQSFIDMVNYSSKFLVRLSELVEPIREHSKDKVPFNWAPEHQEAFNQMKKGDCQSPHTHICVTNRCQY